jgi:hypothetical protein
VAPPSQSIEDYEYNLLRKTFAYPLSSVSEALKAWNAFFDLDARWLAYQDTVVHIDGLICAKLPVVTRASLPMTKAVMVTEPLVKNPCRADKSFAFSR